MPAKKTAAAPVAPPKNWHDLYKERVAEAEREAKGINELFSNLDYREVENFRVVRMLHRHDHGCSTPVEAFLLGLLRFYAREDREGRGLTLAYIEDKLETLRTDYAEAIRDSRFMAARYPQSEMELEAESNA